MAGKEVGTGYVPIKPDTEGFGAELERGLDKEGTPAASRAGDKMAKAAAGAFAAGLALMGKSVIDFGGFEKGMNEVFTLMPGISGEAMDEMTEQVKDFSKEFGVLPTETVPALYEALGAGVPPDNIFDFLETAQKLAKGGVTDLATAVDGLSSVTNAYGADVISATEASDIMFKVVGLGKGTLDDVAGSLFNVTPIASALGVSFEDVGAAMAVLSSKGTPVSVASTQIRSVLGELGKDGTKVSDVFKEMTGKTFAEFIAEGGNLSEALGVIDQAAKDNGLSIMDMFGSIEAGSAALSLAEGNGEAFADAIGQMENAAGSTEAAYDQMNQGLSVTLDRLKTNLAVVMLDIGEAIAPTIGMLGENLGMLLELFSELPGPMQAVAVLLGTLTAGLFAFAGPILKGIQLFKQLGSAMTLLAANPWILVLGALVLGAILIVKHWEEVSAFFVEFGQFFTELWSDIGSFFEAYWPYLLAIFTGGIGLIVALVVTNWDTIYAKISEVAGAIVGAVQGAFTAVWGIVSSVGGSVVGFITGIPEAITGAFVGLANIIAAPFKAAFGAIKIAWNTTVGGFGFDVPGWVPGVGGKGFRIPSMATGGVLTGPQLLLAGEYPGASRDPEVVAPQSVIRETLVDALATTGGAAGAPTNITIERMEVRSEMDIYRIARELDRLAQRETRAQGRPTLASA